MHAPSRQASYGTARRSIKLGYLGFCRPAALCVTPSVKLRQDKGESQNGRVVVPMYRAKCIKTFRLTLDYTESHEPSGAPLPAVFFAVEPLPSNV